ncbi:hypothetical protein ACS8E3_07710 [Psychrobacter sp. 2Y5]|uniref:hypothetical protein n=1 Tax=unclassified Psychrobacter TaxID=196806 RepID=UPI003F472D1C
MCIYVSDTVILTLLFLSGFVGGLLIQYLIMLPEPPTINPHRPELNMTPISSKAPPKPLHNPHK